MLHDNLFHCSKQLTILVANCSVKKVSMTKIAEKDTNLVLCGSIQFYSVCAKLY